jgi:hypothetical protein
MDAKERELKIWHDHLDHEARREDAMPMRLADCR